MVAPGEFFSFHETDIDGAQAAVGKNYFIDRMDLLDPSSPYEFRFDGVSISGLTLGQAWYNAAIDVTMADLQSCYSDDLPPPAAPAARARGVAPQ